MEVTLITQKDTNATFSDKAIAQFLFTHLEHYGDPIEDIQKCQEYFRKKGGFMVVAHKNDVIKGATIVNETGMSKFIPENILVYIAVDADTRGQGVGKKIMEKALNYAKGDVALHVESDNPAKKLYEKLGFTNKYLEMRWKKS